MLGEGILLKFNNTILQSILRLGHGFLDLLYPQDSLTCGCMIPDDGELRHLCPSCFLEVELFRSPCCYLCGIPYQGMVSGPRACPNCLELKPSYNEGKTVFHLHGPMRALIHSLKYEKGTFALVDLVAVVLMSPGLQEYLTGATLVPVPLHPWRHLQRSYNQSELLARMLSRLVPGTRVENLLRRVRWTGSQTRLSRQQRRENLRDAFALRKETTIDPHNRYVVLDDVFTTGATLNACALVLRDAGAVNLDMVALGHG